MGNFGQFWYVVFIKHLPRIIHMSIHFKAGDGVLTRRKMGLPLEQDVFF